MAEVVTIPLLRLPELPLVSEGELVSSLIAAAIEKNLQLSDDEIATFRPTSPLKEALDDELTFYLPPEMTKPNLKRYDSSRVALPIPSTDLLAGKFCDPEFFLALLRHLAVKAGLPDTDLRRRGVSTSLDSRGSRSRFPNHWMVPDALADLGHFIHLNVEMYPFQTAVIAYIRLTNIHPYRDGNGRCAAELFNIIINKYLNVNYILPINGLIACSRGGHIVKLRRAVHLGQWEPIINQFIYYYRLCSEYCETIS